MYAFFALFLLLATPVFAQTQGIDFTTVITDQDGQPYDDCPDKDCKGQHPFTLGLIVARALSNPEPGLDPVESLRRGKLALDLYKNKNVTLSPEDIVLIKQQVAKLFNPIIVYRVFSLIDPNSVKR
jgi:hypothetical protein